MGISTVTGEGNKARLRQVSEMANWGARLLATPNDYKTYRMYKNEFTTKHARRFLSGPRAAPILVALNPEPDLLHDKLRFSAHFGGQGLPVPETLGAVGKAADAFHAPISSEAELIELIQKEISDHLVLKPRSEGQGRGVRVLTGLTSQNPETELSVRMSDGTLEPLSSLVAHVFSSATDWLVQRRLKQHRLLDSLNSTSINTVRLGTFRRSDGTVDFEFSVLRIGRPTSQIDGFNAGGVVVRLDPQTGAFHPVAQQKAKYSLAEVREHPDSGVRFEGLTIPFWDEVLRLATDFAVNSGPNRFIGWDISITPDGPVFLEGNHDWDVQLAQVGSSGLLTDDFVHKMRVEGGINLNVGRLPRFRPVEALRLATR